MAEVAMPPGGARRFVRPILASQVVGKSLRLWLSSLPQLIVVTSIAWLPLFALRWVLRGQTGWRSTVEGSLPMLQLAAVTAVGQAFAVRFIFQRLRGDPTDLARSIAVGARRLGIVLPLALLLALPQFAYVAVNSIFLEELRSADGTRAMAYGPEMLLATIAYIVCQLIVVLVYPVAAPSAVVEGGGVLASLRRSAALTRGRRSTILGIVIAYFLIALVPGSALAFAILTMRAGVAKFLVISAMELFLASLHCVTPVVLYHELRDSREGFGLEDLAAVFD